MILSAGVKLLKGLPKKPLELAVLFVVLTAMTVCSLLAVSFSSVFYILLSGCAGLSVYAVQRLRRKA